MAKLNPAQSRTSTVTPEAQLRSFIEKFDPVQQKLIRAARNALKKRLPAANELVYDNYNFFVIGYSHTERPSDSILSLIADANAVRIAFPYIGSKLLDPHKLLKGSGSMNRALQLESAKELGRPEVEELISAAVGLSKAPLSVNTNGRLIIRSVSAKQRPRRKGR